MNVTDNTLSFPIIGPGPRYEKSHIWLPQLVVEAAQRGEAQIRGKTFVGCFFEGPAVLLPLGDTKFDGCNMGDAMGDTRNLILTPRGPQKVTGAVPFQDCTFTNCHFLHVGFTGAPAFLDGMLKALGGAAEA